jgi:D-alanyl-D-alanine carboxypeptidase (penicillin-binding protein 5/6)
VSSGFARVSHPLKLLAVAAVLALGTVPAASATTATRSQIAEMRPPVSGGLAQHAAGQPSPSTSASPTGPPPLALLTADVPLVDVGSHHTGAPGIVADEAILVDMDTGNILWQHDADKPRMPASTSKMMSALVALQNFSLDQPVRVSPEAANREGVETKMGLLAGETLSVRELLTGMLVVSANDAAMAMAYDTVGMDRYIATMNAQVAALGLHESHFVNPSGYPDDPGQVSSAHDLAVMTMVAWLNFPVFRDLTKIRATTLPASSQHHAFELHNIMGRVFQVYPATVGGKSGFTDGAGPCLITIATRGSHHLLTVLLNARDMVGDSPRMLEWGFAQYGLPPLIPPPTPAPSPSPAAGARR